MEKSSTQSLKKKLEAYRSLRQELLQGLCAELDKVPDLEGVRHKSDQCCVVKMSAIAASKHHVLGAVHYNIRVQRQRLVKYFEKSNTLEALVDKFKKFVDSENRRILEREQLKFVMQDSVYACACAYINKLL